MLGYVFTLHPLLCYCVILRRLFSNVSFQHNTFRTLLNRSVMGPHELFSQLFKS